MLSPVDNFGPEEPLRKTMTDDSYLQRKKKSGFQLTSLCFNQGKSGESIKLSTHCLV
jgi:hypothetical protein